MTDLSFRHNQQESEDNQGVCFEHIARKFLAMWSFVTARVLADLTLRSAPSFGKLSFTSICFTINKFLLAKHKKK